MPRYRLLVEYDGRPYCGFQAQATLPSVQGAIEAAVKAFCGQDLRIAAAGRTDTGVHATGQVVHVDLERDWPARTVLNALNAHLTREAVSILSCEVAEGDWHARFSANERRYLYRILNRPAPPALDKGRVWHVKKPLDAEAMNAAAQHLVGLHDFTTFRDMHCQAKSPLKTLDVARVRRVGDEVCLDFEARSFLHRQVRSMTGTLVEVGIGRWSPDDVQEALAARDRTACGPVAPSDGLYLVGVGYGD
ncbi:MULTISPECIES: tRNA pseudouridine(38-40) synthase TruA [unclassified Caulobacter]|uniref:tRNA pseudouridine(38-40) synthase TruA n=1 Tax=unclassified Caulobacter TaxID=2648921 RepID=UPI000D359FE0|nr:MULTISPECIES: tRNA pseudouridine(38-40) synthase TruA [unclassified Caulobacter]PTS84670.1 tRNA pseudouridine(38-40) synthase TruA [Caulobacter sp. HMWF009]PTT10653.1 tRNA pseudouridine(38-40) synthase TruA [Caulobacter sp. HMWF025]PTT83854.1 tRNA pseudouridine(38-40) synthase TruA [Pseudomonas sp. HMWF010]